MKTIPLIKAIAHNPESQSHFESVRLLFYASMAFFSIKAEWMLVLMGFMAFDTIVGLIKAGKLGDKITPKKFFWGMISKLMIICVPMLLATLAFVFGENLKFMVDVFVRIIIVNEFLSIIANIISIRTGKNVKNLDIITLALKAIRSKFNDIGMKLIQEEIKNDKKENDE